MSEMEILKRGYKIAQKDAQEFIKKHICMANTIKNKEKKVG